MFIRKKPSLLFRCPVHDYTIVTAQCFTGTLPGGIMPVLVLQTDGRTARFSYLQCFLRKLSDQLLLDRMTYVPYKCPVFNQWPLCSVSLRSAPAVSCGRTAFPTLAIFHQRLLDRKAYALRKLPGIQPIVTAQCFTAFWPGRVV